MLIIYLLLVEEGDEKRKFEKLYYMYLYKMLYVANEILDDYRLAEDAVQESFFYLAKNIKTVGEVESPKTRNYVYLIAKHKALDIYRKRKRDNLIFVSEYQNIGSYDNIEAAVNKNRELEHIIRAIHSLPLIYKDCLELHIVYELKANKIAEIMNIKYEVIKKRIQRGKKILRKMILKRYDENQ